MPKATVTVKWHGQKIEFSFDAATWSQVQKIAAATIKESGTK